MLNSRVHTILKVFPPTPSQAPSTLPPCLPIILKSMLRNDGYQAMGEKAALLRTMSIHVTDRMYIFSKCYVGFCTPRRTEMDPRTKKGIVDMRVWVLLITQIPYIVRVPGKGRNGCILQPKPSNRTLSQLYEYQVGYSMVPGENLEHSM